MTLFSRDVVRQKLVRTYPDVEAASVGTEKLAAEALAYAQAEVVFIGAETWRRGDGTIGVALEYDVWHRI